MILPTVVKAENLQHKTEKHKEDIESLEEVINEYLDSYEKHIDDEYDLEALTNIEILDIYDIEDFSEDNGLLELTEAVALKYIHTYNEYDDWYGMFNEEYEIGDEINYIGLYYSAKNITDETFNVAYPATFADINSKIFTNQLRAITSMEHRFEIDSDEEFKTLATFALDELEFEDVEILRIYFPMMYDLEEKILMLKINI